MQETETAVTTKASPNGEETLKKYEPQKDKLNKPKGVEAVTHKVTTGAMKSNVTGEKTYMNALVRCEIFRCGYIVCITNT